MTTEKLLVTKSNNLVEAGYKLTLNEQRLVLMMISQLDGRKPIPKNGDFTITANSFAEAFDISVKQSYEILDEAASRLYERDIKTFDKKAKTRGRFRWVDGVKYWDGEGKVTLRISRHIAPYLSLLHQQFTTYDLKQVTKLNSSYSIRFYELLIQFLKTGERFISLEKVRALFELTTEYPRFYDFKRRILKPSIDEINKHTDLVVEWDVKKKGRTITGLVFIFEKKIAPSESRCLHTKDMFEDAL
jgi:plasmid replication initiation protein